MMNARETKEEKRTTQATGTAEETTDAAMTDPLPPPTKQK